MMDHRDTQLCYRKINMDLIEHTQTEANSPLTEAERDLLLYTWNATYSAYPRESRLHDLVSAQAVKTPERIALRFADQSLTYAELEARSDRLAEKLSRMGVGVETLVGLYIERSFEMIIGVLGILKAGGAYIPIDPAFPAARIELMLADARPSVLVTNAHLQGNINTEPLAVLCMDQENELYHASSDQAQAQNFINEDLKLAGPENLAYVIYTSGSTGRPKGVQITHRSAVNLLTAVQREPGLTADDRLLAVSTLSFDISLIELFLPLICGAEVIIASSEAVRDGQQLQQLLEEHDVTLMQATPATWRMLLESGWSGKENLKIISGGEALRPDLVDKLLPRCEAMWNMYGPTETTVYSTLCRIDSTSEPITIGRPLTNTQIYILDKNRQPVSIGAVGQLYIGGDGVARGYLNRPQLTADRFVTNPFSKNGATVPIVMYNTGDLASYLPDGRIKYLGRDDFQVKIRGFRIELGDVEAAVSRHLAVSHNVTIVREDTPGDKQLVTYLIPEKSMPVPGPGALRAFLRQTLPEYMLPARFVILDKLPVLPNGKLNRKALPPPGRISEELETEFTPPTDELERAVAELFAEVLNLERVGIHDSFFDLGGNSLLATRLLFKAQNRFQVRATQREFFKQPTVWGLSQLFKAAPQEAAGSIDDSREAVQLLDEKLSAGAPNKDQALLEQSNLTRGQFLMWLGQQLNEDAPLYNVVDAFTIHASLDVGAFQRAFQALVEHHDTLRTVIHVENGIPQQKVLEKVTALAKLVDFSSRKDPESAYRAWLDARKTRRLRLDQRLFDAALLKLAEDRFVWYLCQHHMVTDAVSAELLFERLAVYYQMALDGRLDGISTPPQFTGFVDYERQLRRTADYKRALRYWREKYGAPLSPTAFYGSVGEKNSLRSARVACVLGPERSEKLREIAGRASFASPSQDMSLFTIFATLLFTTLHRINGRTTLRLGAPYHGRPTAESLDIVGLFIEMGLMQVDIEAGETFISLGEKVIAETLDGLAHMQPGISSAEANRAYDVVLNYIQAKTQAFAGLSVTRESVAPGYIDADHKLRIWVTDLDASGNFVLYFDAKIDVFGKTERDWLVEHFLRVVDAFVADPTRPLGDFPLISAAERQQLLVDFNATDAPYPAEKTVVQLFEKQAAATPHALAAVEGERMISYTELNARANQLARHLRAQGVGPEAAVAICMERSIEVLTAIWGVLKAGGAYIPIDPTYPRDRIEVMLNDASPVLILTADDDALSGLQRVTETAVNNLTQLDLSGYSDANLSAVAQPDNLVYVIYTSGSTGKPKGALLTHRGLLNYAWWARGVYQNNRPLDFPLYSSLAFDLTVTSLFVPLLSGGKVVIYRKSQGTPGLEILTVFEDDAVDIVKLTPAHLSLVRELNLTNRRIRKLIVGGEDFKTDLARAIHAQFGGEVEIYNEYGPTEAVVGCMLHRFDPERDTAVSVPIGTPAANARIYLLDAYDQPTPPGVIGEMVISSDGVARGYHQRPDLSAAHFGDDPFRSAARTYRTGDIARWNAQGQMIFLGRRDHQVKIGGARIELGEIESRLLAHDAIQDAVVTVVEFESRPDPSKIFNCVICGLPSNYPDVSFNEEGVCSLCTDFDTFRDDVFRYFKTMDDLHVIVEKAKAERKGEYDCMMLYSGGKDSTYVLTQLVEMGLKVLAFSLDNGYISEEAKANVRRITSHLNVDLVFGETPHMNAIFVDSLERYSNVCQGCYKAIYTLSMNLARRKGIKYIFTGLSRGQLFETRLDELFRNRMFDVSQMDAAVTEARKLYHRADDAVYRLLDVSIFSDDRVFDEIQFVDYYRYTDVELDDLYTFLSSRVPWMRPADTGRSTNCLINEAGIYVHQTERGYHNYALPYSWDVRLGHKTREETMEELNDEMRMPMVHQMLDEIGYQVKDWRAEQADKRLAVYYVSRDEALTIAELRAYLAEALPAYMIPAYFVRLEALPLTSNGKVNRKELPSPTEKRPELNAAYVAPQSPLEKHLADIWSQSLNVQRVGIHDNFLDLGGASVPAVQVVAKISGHFGVTFPISSFFDHPTIAEQCEIIEGLLIEELETMSDDEAAALLAEMGD